MRSRIERYILIVEHKFIDLEYDTEWINTNISKDEQQISTIQKI